MNKELKEKIIFITILIVCGISYRLLDYPPNFSPLSAIALFAGFYFRNYIYSLITLLVLFISDCFTGFYDYRIMLSVYLCFFVIFFIGRSVKKHYSLKAVIFGSLSGAVLFYLATNFAVWFFGNWYDKSFSGLIRCFFLALPFFRNTIAGDLFFSGIFFGLYETVLHWNKNQILKYFTITNKL
jgi:hypothetical protein